VAAGLSPGDGVGNCTGNRAAHGAALFARSLSG
jgi:hypothetical protein